MKKFQLWLQRKQYAQHLFNLIKIKKSNHLAEKYMIDQKHIIRKKNNNSQAMLRTINYEPSKIKQEESKQKRSTYDKAKRESTDPMGKSYSREKSVDEIYFDATKSTPKHRLRALGSFRVQKQNQTIVRRLKEARSVVQTVNKRSVATANGGRKLFDKKCESTHIQLRKKDFEKYVNWQHDHQKISYCKYVLDIRLNCIPKMFNQSVSQSIWAEIQNPKCSVRSQIQESSLGQYEFSFNFDEELPFRTVLIVYKCRGLKHQQLGSFRLQTLTMGKYNKTIQSLDGKYEIEAIINYQATKRPTISHLLR